MPTKERAAALKKRQAKAERQARLEIHWANQREKEKVARALSGALRSIADELQSSDQQSLDKDWVYNRIVAVFNDRAFWERKALPKADTGVPMFLAVVEKMLAPLWPEFKRYIPGKPK